MGKHLCVVHLSMLPWHPWLEAGHQAEGPVLDSMQCWFVILLGSEICLNPQPS